MIYNPNLSSPESFSRRFVISRFRRLPCSTYLLLLCYFFYLKGRRNHGWEWSLRHRVMGIAILFLRFTQGHFVV